MDKQELPFSQSVFKIVAAPPKDMTEMARAHQNVGIWKYEPQQIYEVIGK